MYSPYEKKQSYQNDIQRGVCPFCGGENLFYNDKGFTCFDCFESGTETDYLARKNNLSPYLARWQLSDVKPKDNGILEEACSYFQEKLSECKYLKQRKISPETAEKFRIGYAPGGLCAWLLQKYTKAEILEAGLGKLIDGEVYDVFYNRMIFPIMNKTGKVIAFGGRRVIDSPAPKYLNSKETPTFMKRDWVYGLNDIDNTDTVYIVEGYMDVISLHQAGVTNAVACLGTAVTEQHCQLLKSMRKKNVIICLDSDEPGIIAALKSIKILKKYFNVTVLNVPGSKDPDEFIKEKGLKAFTALQPESWQKFYAKHKGISVDILSDLN